MAIVDILYKEYKGNKKSRTEKHSSYPDRFEVPIDKTTWSIVWDAYQPVVFNAPIVMDKHTSWADPQDIQSIHRNWSSFEGKLSWSGDGFPQNPFGRTGITGRGVLGKWGPNFAVDGIITTLNPGTNDFQVLTILRSDTGENAFPGGMVDPGEDALTTRNRELAEELSLSKIDLDKAVYEKAVTIAYVDDPRNTDHAWMETTVIHSHFGYEVARKIHVKAGDDASAFQWVTITENSIFHFYANHGYSLLNALHKLIHTGEVNLPDDSKEKFMKTFYS